MQIFSVAIYDDYGDLLFIDQVEVNTTDPNAAVAKLIENKGICKNRFDYIDMEYKTGSRYACQLKKHEDQNYIWKFEAVVNIISQLF